MLAQLYSQYRKDFIQWLQATYSCDEQEAKDTYQVTILQFYENVVSGKLITLTSTLKTYLYAIGKNKYRERLRHLNRHLAVQHEEGALEHEPEGPAMKEEKLLHIEGCLDQLGEPCRSLLIQFYYHGNSVAQLCHKFGYKSEGSAKSQKYKCLQRLRKLVLGVEGNLSIKAG